MPRILLLLSLLVLFSGCSKDSHEEVAREYLDVMGRFVATCDAISDPAEAKQSKEKLGQLLDELKALKSRSSDLGDADKATQSKIEKRYEKEFTTLSASYTKAVEKIEKNPEVVEELETELKTLASLVNARPIRLRR